MALLLAGCRPAPAPPLRVSVVGDVLLARGVPAALASDSAALARRCRAWWRASRYVVGNLECPLADTARPLARPVVFRAATHWGGWLRRVGFTHVSLANNHAFDQHLPGLRATARVARAARLGVLGFAPDSAAGCLPTLLGPDRSVAVLAYSDFRLGTAGEGCVCGRDFAALCERLAAYKTLFPARAVLVLLHWGTEYAGQPTERQRRQARTLIDCGAAAVVGCHPHVVQSVSYYRGRPIVYSLGNFLFDQRGATTDLALQADFDLRDGRVTATYLRPLQLVRALPRRAEGHARATLAARLRRSSPGVGFEPTGPAGGWRLRPDAAGRADDGPAGYFARQVTIAGPAGPATARLRPLPHARQTQVWLTAPGGAASALAFRYPVYAFGAGDVDNDGYPDLLVGPVKPTRFDSAWHRRLFVYALDTAGQLRPRWRGSRLSYRLLYFRAAKREAGRTEVRTIEQRPDGRYAIGRYHWQGFGLVLDGFAPPLASLDAAYRAFVR